MKAAWRDSALRAFGDSEVPGQGDTQGRKLQALMWKDKGKSWYPAVTAQCRTGQEIYEHYREFLIKLLK